MTTASDKRHRSALASYLLAMVFAATPQPGHATDATRIQQLAAELNVPRRAWTICTVNEVGRAIQAGEAADALTIANRALANCSDEERALHAKAGQLLGTDAAERLMARLVAEAHDALVGSARTLAAAKSAGAQVEPAWPRVLGAAH